MLIVQAPPMIGYDLDRPAPDDPKSEYFDIEWQKPARIVVHLS